MPILIERSYLQTQTAKWCVIGIFMGFLAGGVFGWHYQSHRNNIQTHNMKYALETMAKDNQRLVDELGLMQGSLNMAYGKHAKEIIEHNRKQRRSR